MTEFNNVHAAALAAGATLVSGGIASFKLGYGRPRRAAAAKVARQTRTKRRLDSAVRQVSEAPQERVRPAARVVEAANRAAASVAPAHPPQASLDVGTLEELLAGLFSLRSDLTTLAAELSEMRDHAA